MSETIPVCADPACDSARIRRNTPDKPSTPSGGKWYCVTCETYFSEPRYRQRRSQGVPGGTLAARLLHADPEAVSADD